MKTRTSQYHMGEPQRGFSKLDRLDDLFDFLNRSGLANAQQADIYSQIGAREALLPGQVQQLNASGALEQARAKAFPETHAAELDALKYSKLGQLGHLTNYLPANAQMNIVNQLLTHAGLLQPEAAQADPNAELRQKLHEYLAQKAQGGH